MKDNKRFVGKSILIAEDDDTTLSLLQLNIENLGCKVFTAPDGGTALEIIHSGVEISAVLTDVVMPGISGRELVRIIKTDSSSRHLPVIIVSAVVGVKEIADLLDAGVTWFVSKPVDMDELSEILIRIFNDIPAARKIDKTGGADE